MAANRKNKLSTKRKRVESRDNSPSLSISTVGLKNKKAGRSLEYQSDALSSQTTIKAQKLQERTTRDVSQKQSADPSHQTPVCTGVTSKLWELRQRLAAHWPVYKNWRNLPDLPVVNCGIDHTRTQEEEKEHKICSIGGISFQWSPLPPPCNRCMKRKRVEFSPALLNNAAEVTSLPSKQHGNTVKTPQSMPKAKSFEKSANHTPKQPGMKIQALPYCSREKGKPANLEQAKSLQAIPIGGMRRKTNFVGETVSKATDGKGVGTAVLPSSVKSQRATKTDDRKTSMHKVVQREQPKYQANKVQGPKGEARPSTSQSEGLKTFLSGAKPSGKNTKVLTRAAPLFKKPASTRQVELGPSTSGGLSKVGNGAKSENKTEVLRSCPMCQEEFPKGMSQLDMDGHIAACLSASNEDIMW